MPEKRCWCVGNDSNWWHKDILSASSSFMATNCPETIFATSLAVIGGRADDSTMAVPGLLMLAVGELTEAVTRAGRVANDCMALMA